MSERVSLIYDDGSKTDFNSLDDLLFHVDTQGLAGVVEAVSNDEDDSPTDEVVLTRDELNDRSDEEKDELRQKVVSVDDSVDADAVDADEGGEE